MVNRKRIRKTLRAADSDWRRVDLHLHTPASADWQEPGAAYLQWLQKADSRSLDVVAITDHNTVEGVARLRGEIERLTWLEANERLRPQERRELDEYRRLGEKVLVLPGFEFTATFGFHILAIFPPDTPLRMLELLLLRLNVPVERLSEGSTEIGASTDVVTAYRLINEAGGLVIAAHANSTHGVAMRGLSFGGQTKIAFTQDPHLHALEVTDLESTGRRSTAQFFDGSKPVVGYGHIDHWCLNHRNGEKGLDLIGSSLYPFSRFSGGESFGYEIFHSQESLFCFRGDD